MNSVRTRWRLAAVTVTTALAVLMFSNSSAYAVAPGESTRWANEIEDNVPVAASGIMGEARADNSDLIQVWRGADNANMYLSLDHGRPMTLAGQTNASPQVVYVGGTQFMLFHTGTNGFIFFSVLRVNVANNGQRYLQIGDWRQVGNDARTNDGRPVAAVALPHNNVYMAYHGANSNEIWGMTFNIPGNYWDAPLRTFGATSDSSPSLAFSPNNNHILLAYRGTDNRVNVIRANYQSQQWYGRSILDGVLTDSQPAIGITPNGWGQVAVREQGTGLLHMEDISDTGARGSWVRESNSFTSPYGPRLIMDAYRAYLVATAWGGYVFWKQSRQY
ncbi:hypothetical protein [Kitasatospora sp. NPDC094016]|uniref:hypothetical protein n=1 Tax=unclassified Kitasatospora TaxID=2633591 RepID=UPI0033290F19